MDLDSAERRFLTFGAKPLARESETKLTGRSPELGDERSVHRGIFVQRLEPVIEDVEAANALHAVALGKRRFHDELMPGVEQMGQLHQ